MSIVRARVKLQTETRVRCNLYIDNIVRSRVWRVTLSLDELLSAPDILRNTLNSLCHVVFVVEAFIDLKCFDKLG